MSEDLVGLYRTDVAYVGRIESDQYVMALISNGSAPQYFIPYAEPVDGQGIIRVILSQGAVGDLASGNLRADITYLIFRITYYQGKWLFYAYDLNGMQMGGLALSGQYLILNTEPTPLSLNPIDPHMNLDDQLLTGVRYFLPGLIFRYEINCSDLSGDLGGLKTNCQAISENISEAFTWTFITTLMASYLRYTPLPLEELPGPVAITQCISMDSTGYGESSYCIDWPSYVGFSNSDDVRDIIYYYSEGPRDDVVTSEGGECGQAYQMITWLNQTVEVSSSMGLNCEDHYQCDLVDNTFQCVEVIPEGDGVLNENLGDTVTQGRGILESPILWIAVILAILFIILLLIFLGVRFHNQ